MWNIWISSIALSAKLILSISISFCCKVFIIKCFKYPKLLHIKWLYLSNKYSSSLYFQWHLKLKISRTRIFVLAIVKKCSSFILVRFMHKKDTYFRILVKYWSIEVLKYFIQHWIILSQGSTSSYSRISVV